MQIMMFFKDTLSINDIAISAMTILGLPDLGIMLYALFCEALCFLLLWCVGVASGFILWFGIGARDEFGIEWMVEVWWVAIVTMVIMIAFLMMFGDEGQGDREMDLESGEAEVVFDFENHVEEMIAGDDDSVKSPMQEV